MKLTCDICNGTLQMMSDGRGAICTNCGVTYSIERLREKMGADTSSYQTNYSSQYNSSYNPEPDKTAWQQPSYESRPNRYVYIKRNRDLHLCKYVAIIDGEQVYELQGAGKTTAIPVSYGTHTINIQVASSAGVNDLGVQSFNVTGYDYYGEVGLKRGAFKASYQFAMAEQR